ncbi:hypothetical protein ACEV6Q_15130 [Enterobacter ludwigii]|uniref:hypothetical protein n=1 Tax=Enterobacter ludwigii TaxID=299767 RepID=UPI003BEF01BB
METQAQDDYRGLTLEPETFASYIAPMLETVRIFLMSSDESIRMTGDKILDIASDYANAVAGNVLKDTEIKTQGEA